MDPARVIFGHSHDSLDNYSQCPRSAGATIRAERSKQWVSFLEADISFQRGHNIKLNLRCYQTDVDVDVDVDEDESHSHQRRV